MMQCTAISLCYLGALYYLGFSSCGIEVQSAIRLQCCLSLEECGMPEIQWLNGEPPASKAPWFVNVVVVFCAFSRT